MDTEKPISMLTLGKDGNGGSGASVSETAPNPQSLPSQPATLRPKSPSIPPPQLPPPRPPSHPDSDSGEELLPIRKPKKPPHRLILKKPIISPTEPIISQTEPILIKASSPKDDYDPHSLEDYWLESNEIERRNARRNRPTQPKLTQNPQIDDHFGTESCGKLSEDGTESHQLGGETTKMTPKPSQLAMESQQDDHLDITPKSTLNEGSLRGRIDSQPGSPRIDEEIYVVKGPNFFISGTEQLGRTFPRRDGDNRKRNGRIGSADSLNHAASLPSFPNTQKPSLHPLSPIGHSPQPHKKKRSKRLFKAKKRPQALLALNTPGDLAGAYFASSRSVRELKTAAGGRLRLLSQMGGRRNQGRGSGRVN